LGLTYLIVKLTKIPQGTGYGADFVLTHNCNLNAYQEMQTG